jgi:hypothetical protein
MIKPCAALHHFRHAATSHHLGATTSSHLALTISSKSWNFLPTFHNHRHAAARHHLGFANATTSHHLSHAAAYIIFPLVLPFTATPSARLEALPIEGLAVLTLPILEAPHFCFDHFVTPCTSY